NDSNIDTKNNQTVREKIIQREIVKDIIANGETKVSVTINDENEVKVDFRMVEQPAFAATLHHLTESKEHNVQMRQLAKSRGEKINEYGVMIEETEELVQFESEKSFFAHFGLQEIPPEMREATGEVEAFR